MFLLPTAQGCCDSLFRTGSKLRLTTSTRSSATTNSQHALIARLMARTASMSRWRVPRKIHRLRHQRDVMLGGRSEAHRASRDREPTLRRRPGKAARRKSLPRNRTATQPFIPRRMTIPGLNRQKPQLTKLVPIAGMYPELWCPQMASRAIMAERAPCMRRASRSDHR